MTANKSESKYSLTLLNPTAAKCRIFDGNTCFEWLTFLSEWKAFMQHLGVKEVILKGTFFNGPFEEIEYDCTDLKTSFFTWQMEKERRKYYSTMRIS